MGYFGLMLWDILVTNTVRELNLFACRYFCMDSDSVSLRYQKIHLSQKDQLSQMKNQMMFQIFSRFDNSRFWEFVYVDHTCEHVFVIY